MTPQETLLAAISLIEKRGLSRGGLVDSHGRICPVHAIMEASRASTGASRYGIWSPEQREWSIAAREAYKLFIDTLAARGLAGQGVGEWADNSPPEEVLGVLRQAAGINAHEGELVA